MIKLADFKIKIRSKNAGPFWVTIDIFCGSAQNFTAISAGLDISIVAEVYKIPLIDIKRFDLSDLNVIKISFPRPIVQGHPLDRDQHGAQYAVLLQDIPLKPGP